jgi:hypothetical protein
VTITSERLHDPQQLNAYAYVRNNPLKLVDPTDMILQLSGDIGAAKDYLCQIAGTDLCSRIGVDANNIVSFDTKDLDLSANAGAALINDLIISGFTYGFSVGPTVMTAGGLVKVAYLENLPPFEDQLRYRKNGLPADSETPGQGVDDQVAFNPKDTRGKKESLTKLKLADPYSVVFHELAEAYSKVDAGKKTWAEGHQDAIKREELLRDQRPYLKQYNPGSGSGGPQGGADTKIIIKR